MENKKKGAGVEAISKIKSNKRKQIKKKKKKEKELEGGGRKMDRNK